MKSLLFLSHIHEEKTLAMILKEAIEEEFGGFVTVFVSSDGSTVPAGSNFLKRIENGLLDCVGAIYLLSPHSVKRNWINFELGAVWIRNISALRDGDSEVPTLPLCHSGMKPTTLPMPLANLNGVVANQSSQLEFAFRSIQKAVGGSGQLHTNFDALATKVTQFEQAYTVGFNLRDMLKLLGYDVRQVVAYCKDQPSIHTLTLQSDFVETSIVQRLRSLEEAELKGHIVIRVGPAGKIQTRPSGPVNGIDLEVKVKTALLLQFELELLA